jgi:site-specific DNA recombinase
MIADIKKDKTIVAILVYSYDRFSRSGSNGIFLVESLKKIGVRIIAITQIVESFTATGKFHENLYMLLSKFDNDQRRDKSMAGTKSILQKGYWPYTVPLGYTNTNKHARADLHTYIINEQGVLIKQAFRWKSSGKYSNKSIIGKLASRGLKVSLRNMAWIFSNPFYCGYITSCLLPGELITGKHPPLIDVDTFLVTNQISQRNSISGVPKRLNVEELPLKIFMKDQMTGSPFTGYHHKKKDIYYYKSRAEGSKVNVSAKLLIMVLKMSSNVLNIIRN